MSGYRAIFRDGLWNANPGLVQLLGLCPLLAVSNTVVNALGLGLATIFVLCAANGLVSATRRFVHPAVRLPAFVLVIATFVTIVELVFQAYFYELWLSLGLFVPLIVTNCAILARAEMFASREPLLPSLADGLAHGAGFSLVLIALGALREAIGRGTLLAGAEQLLGPAGAGLEISLGGGGFLLAVLPPGAFIALGFLVAARNALVARRAGDPGNRGEPTGTGGEAETAGR